MSADTDGWVAVGFSSDKKMVRNGMLSLFVGTVISNVARMETAQQESMSW